MTTPTTSIFHRRFNTLNRSAIHTKLVVATDPKRCTKYNFWPKVMGRLGINDGEI